MKKTNIILSIFNGILSIALIVMVLLYLNAIKMSKNNLESQLNSANEVFELNKKVQELEEELEKYKKPNITTTVTNSANTNNVTSTEPYIPDGMPVADPNDNSGIKAGDIVFDTKPENVTIEVLEDTITDKSVEILITDTNKDKYGWGVQFAVQKKINKKWENLEYILDEISWIEIAYNLDNNNQLKQKLNIEKYYGKLDKGTYRIVKTQWSNNEYIDLYSNDFEIN